jgi:hypothetical protein
MPLRKAPLVPTVISHYEFLEKLRDGGAKRPPEFKSIVGTLLSLVTYNRKTE